MISYSRDPKQEIPSSAVKILGLGGAGANMLERIALDSMEGAELLALNTDIRTLGASLAKDKIQLGVNLTKGLGTGGDPELGHQAMLEAEKEVREALKGQQIVFLCTGLGGGTGSGAAPIITRIAREEGAFVVVFATMPFFFEGRRRREQAETSLNELAVLSNALVTFDNNRMGELVLAKQGIHEAFSAADKMISESIKAVIRLVIRPGLINIGLDDLMSALRTTRSRCLFGSGIADGKDRASKALRNALSSPLLDQGSLLKEAQTVLVHLSGGESLTLFEIELLMQNLQKHVPEQTHVLFGAAIDPAMGDQLSITLISALPEDALSGTAKDSIESVSKDNQPLEIENPFTKIDKKEATKETSPSKKSIEPNTETDAIEETSDEPEEDKSLSTSIPSPRPKVDINIGSNASSASEQEEPSPQELEIPESEGEEQTAPEQRPFAEPELIKTDKLADSPLEEKEPDLLDEWDEDMNPDFNTTVASKNLPEKKKLWGKKISPPEDSGPDADSTNDDQSSGMTETEPKSKTELKLDGKRPGSQSELSFDNAPRGRFEGENPNVFEGEDLDLPPFLRKKKS